MMKQNSESVPSDPLQQLNQHHQNSIKKRKKKRKKRKENQSERRTNHYGVKVTPTFFRAALIHCSF
jgi:F0F1-type ATP synthase assembly protein I